MLKPALAGRIRIDWHLSAGDFTSPEASALPRLLRLARLALESAPLSFVMDRPGQPLPLAEGIDRQHPAVLMTIGLNLPRLLQLPDVGGDVERFLNKLASLTRMAVSAGVQKRNYLRRRQDGVLSRGFLLDRARMVAVPIGLEMVVRALAGSGICSGRAASELAEQIASSLAANLRQAGNAASLDVCVAGVSWASPVKGFTLAEQSEAKLPAIDQAAGLTCWDMTADAKTQIKKAGLLHAAAGPGTAAVFISHDRPPSPEDIVELLQFAWKSSTASRVQFVRVPHQQEHLPWKEG